MKPPGKPGGFFFGAMDFLITVQAAHSQNCPRMRFTVVVVSSKLAGLDLGQNRPAIMAV
jgi:hypothetical protein